MYNQNAMFSDVLRDFFLSNISCFFKGDLNTHVLYITGLKVISGHGRIEFHLLEWKWNIFVIFLSQNYSEHQKFRFKFLFVFDTEHQATDHIICTIITTKPSDFVVESNKLRKNDERGFHLILSKNWVNSTHYKVFVVSNFHPTKNNEKTKLSSIGFCDGVICSTFNAHVISFHFKLLNWRDSWKIEFVSIAERKRTNYI